MLDDGAFNIIIQSSLSASSAVTFDLELDNNNRFEVGYKAYSSGYHSGIFYQAGAAVHSGDNKSEVGINAKIGYEHSPAKNFVFFGAVKAEYLITSDNMVYSPVLGAMVAF